MAEEWEIRQREKARASIRSGRTDDYRVFADTRFHSQSPSRNAKLVSSMSYLGFDEYDPGYNETSIFAQSQLQRTQFLQQMKNAFVDEEHPVSITNPTVGLVIFGRLFTSEEYMLSDERHPCVGHVVEIEVHPSVLGFANDLAHIYTMKSFGQGYEPEVKTVIRCKEHKKRVETTSNHLFDHIELYDSHKSHLIRGETHMMPDGTMVKPNA